MLEPFRTAQIADDDGAVHAYTIRLHPATTGRVLALRIAALGLVPLAEVLVSALVAGVRGKAAAEAISPDALQRGLSELPAAVGRLADNPALISDLFAHVERDGVPMSVRVHFDAAYTGNYGEMAAAIWEVIKVNRFFPAQRISALLPKRPATPPTPAS